MNKQTIIGRVTKDHELKKGGTGTKYLKLSVASDGDNGETKWYNVTLFKTLAENFMAHTGGKKGIECKFLGRNTMREYTRTGGGTGVSNDFIADAVYLEGGVVLDKFTPVANGPEVGDEAKA